MIFKVLYQETPNEAPIRERTKSVYVEADSKRNVRKKLIDRNYNIEFIQQLDEAHLNYEENSANFVLEKL
ncbi:DNA-dependent RNA polymerase subunit epsilon [Virgibacillus sp. W0430]|uniref:DNA-dependent RNA polymerase subunit epsilon n=1 Tax=Virgibacillus sp. W0430 TaxID=3391580 RepID=UPI003F475009